MSINGSVPSFKQPPASTTPAKPVMHPSWNALNLADMVRNGLKVEKTSLLARTDGFKLFYAGKVNTLFGNSESLKTWVALLAAVQEIRDGNAVMMIDYEDHPVSMARRLVEMGITADQLEQQFYYLRPESAFDDEAADYVQAVVEGQELNDAPMTLVIVDATTEAMSKEELDINSATDVARYYATYLKRIADMGPAVVSIDHVSKAFNTLPGEETMTGSQHKKSGMTGAQYFVREDPENRFGRGRAGKSYLELRKDKNGYAQQGVASGRKRSIGTFHIESKAPLGVPVTDDTLFNITAYIEVPKAPSTDKLANGEPVKVAIAKAITDLLKEEPNGSFSKTQIADQVGVGKRAERFPHCQFLIDHEWVTVDAKGKLQYARDYVEEQHADAPDV